MTLGVTIRTARKAKGKSQADIADAMGVSVQAVSQWETDKTSPGAINLLKLSKLLDFSLDAGMSIRDMLTSMAPVSDDGVRIRAPLVDWKNHEKWRRFPAEFDDWGNDLGSLYVEEYYDVHWKPVGEVFALQTNGGFMPEFKKGDVIIVDTGRAPEPDDFVIAHLEKTNQLVFASFFPKGIDEHRAPIFELRFQSKYKDPILVDPTNPGIIVGTVREHRRYFRTS